MHKEEKELGKKSITAFAGQIVGQIVAISVMILSGRLLGADIYGQLVYGLTILNFLTTFTKMGLGGGLMSFVSRGNLEREEKRWIVSFCIRFSGIASVVLILALYLLREPMMRMTGNNSITQETMLRMLPFVLLQTLIWVMAGAIRGQREIGKYYMATQIIGNGVSLLAIPILYYLFRMKNIDNLLIAFYLGYLLELVYCCFYLCRGGLIRGEKKKYPWREIMRFSVPLFLTGAIGALNTEIDKYMVGFFLVSSQVAIYSTAASIGRLAGYTLESVNSIFAPMISDLYHRGETGKLKDLYSMATKWILSINMMILGMVLVFSDDIMRIAGEEFAAGNLVLLIVLSGQIINSGMGPVSYLNSMTGHPEWDMCASVIAVVANIFLNYILLPRLGLTGIGIATALSLILQRVINFILMYRHLHIHPYHKGYLGIATAFLPGVLLLAGLRELFAIHFLPRLFLCGIVYTLFYSFVLYKTVCDREEKELVNHFLYKLCRMGAAK